MLTERNLLVEDGAVVGCGPERMRKADRLAVILEEELYTCCFLLANDPDHLVRQQYKHRIR